MLLFLYLGLEWYAGRLYNEKRDNNFRAFEWDFDTLWRLKPSYQGITFLDAVHTNSAGFRGGEEYPLISQHALRILVLGDSRTYGFGVKDDETYSVILEANLRQRGIDAEVINAGVHGFSIVQCRRKLELLLPYHPKIVTLAVGYNDRRYVVTRPPDSTTSFAYIAALRKTVDFFCTSNLIFSIIYKTGKQRIDRMTADPPALDCIPPRVPLATFREELNKTVQICRDHQIQLVFLLLYQDPNANNLVETAGQLVELGEYSEAIEMIEDAFNTVADRAFPMSRYYLGLSYRRIGNEKKAQEVLKTHRLVGSIFGDWMLLREKPYFDVIRQTGEEFNIPIVDEKAAVEGTDLDPYEAEEKFETMYFDECHLLPIGHRFVGNALADRIALLSASWHD